MTRIMRDSTTPADIPVQGTDLVAGYVNGDFKWSEEGWHRFHGVPHVRIDVFGNEPEHSAVLNVEPGCAEVPTAVVWAKKKNAAFPGRYRL